MKKKIYVCITIFFASVLPVSIANAAPAILAVVDTGYILTESLPGKAGDEHLRKVREVLQQGLDELQHVYRGKENTDEAQSALRQGHTDVEQQLMAERQAILQALGDALQTSVKAWRTKNSHIQAVISKQLLLDFEQSIDVTAAILQEMNRQQVVFSPLPAVQVTPLSQ